MNSHLTKKVLFMNNYFLKRQIEQIEQEANDDFAQILEFGARCYPTRELHQLLHQLDLESYQYNYFKRLLFLIAGSTTFWIAFFFLFQSLEFKAGIYFTIIMVLLSVVVFTAGTVHLNRKFKSIRQSALIERIITEELERRRKDASIF
jgi:hypothetical protein